MTQSPGWRVVTMAQTPAGLPPPGPTEVAFAGRSNCGKSSLVNALTRTRLARVARKPGRTDGFVFYTDAGARATLVDTPGYGWAARSDKIKVLWDRLARAYFASERPITRVFVLLDARRGVGVLDQGLLAMLAEVGVAWTPVLTKIDKLTPTQREAARLGVEASLGETSLRTSLGASPETSPGASPIVMTSARTGDGTLSLRKLILSLSAPARDRL